MFLSNTSAVFVWYARFRMQVLIAAVSS